MKSSLAERKAGRQTDTNYANNSMFNSLIFNKKCKFVGRVIRIPSKKSSEIITIRTSS